MDVTVIVPCFNSEKTMACCLDSILNQTVKAAIFIMNDGSTDSTLSIAERYAAEHENVRVFSHPNRGLPQTRKAGLELVETKYTAFIDSDDWIEPDMLETLIRLSEARDADIAACGLILETGNKSTPSGAAFPQDVCLTGSEALRCVFARRAVYQYMCNKIFKTSCIRRFTFPEGHFTGEDFITLSSFLDRVPRVAVSGKSLYHYVFNVQSMSRAGYGPGYRKSFEQFSALYAKYERERSPEQCRELGNYLCPELEGVYLSMIRNGNFDPEAVAYIRAFLKEHLRSFRNEQAALYYKLAAAGISFFPGLFNLAYRIYQRMRFGRPAPRLDPDASRRRSCSNETLSS